MTYPIHIEYSVYIVLSEYIYIVSNGSYAKRLNRNTIFRPNMRVQSFELPAHHFANSLSYLIMYQL